MLFWGFPTSLSLFFGVVSIVVVNVVRGILCQLCRTRFEFESFFPIVEKVAFLILDHLNRVPKTIACI